MYQNLTSIIFKLEEWAIAMGSLAGDVDHYIL
jgi:hypothetical protein